MADYEFIRNKAVGGEDGDKQEESGIPFVGKAVDAVSDMGTEIKKAWTGEEKQIEYPNAEEMTDIDIGFFDQLGPMLKMMISRSDTGKAEIIRDAYEGDKRFGGAFIDKFKNPMIVWENKPYYINKPGATETDFSNVLSEIVKFLPITKWTQAGKGTGKKTLRGTVGYGGTETANVIGEEIVSPETSKSKDAFDRAAEIGTSTAIGVGTDIAVPPAVSVLGKGLKAIVPQKVKDVLPTLTKDVYETITKSDYDLSKGQATSKPFIKGEGSAMEQASPQIIKEHIMRTSKGEGADIMQGLDRTQLNSIRSDADKLWDEIGSSETGGLSKQDIPYESVTGVKKIVTGQAQKLKKSAKNIYESQNLSELSLTPEGINKFADNAIEAIKSKKIGARVMGDMPVLTRELKWLRRLKKLSSKPNFKQKPFSVMRDYQKSLNTQIKNVMSKAPDSPEAAFLLTVKKELDDFITQGIDNAFIVGDETIIKDLLKANKDYRAYLGLTGKDVGRDGAEKAANNILKKLTNPGLDADAVVNTFFGNARFQPASTMRLVLQKIKQNIPKEQYKEVVALVKDGVLTRGFSGKGESGVTRTNIINNYNQTFKRNRGLIKMLFSEDELKRIGQFKDNVLPTLWAEINLNPSNSGNLLMFGMVKKGLLSYAGRLPLGGMIDPGSYKGIGEARSAYDAVKGYLNRKQAPLFTTTTQAPIRAEGEELPTSEIIKDLGLTNIPKNLKNKIFSATQPAT